MASTTIEWSAADSAIGSQALLQVYPGGLDVNGRAVYQTGVWGRVIVGSMIEASHLAWVAKGAAMILKKGEAVTPSHPMMARVLTDSSLIIGKKIGDPSYRALADADHWEQLGLLEQWKQLNLEQAGLAYLATEACCTKIYRTALLTKLPAIELFPVQPPEGVLGIAPIVVGALVLVAMAATAAIAWVEIEESADNREVRIETARATSESTLAMEIAKTQIANGLPVNLPDNLMNWGRRQRTLTDPWFKVAAGVGIVGTGAVAGYAGYKLGGQS